ncbi:TraR/DksA family transcriptional regulator [Arenivirga flava]|uniref:Zinc finger DksA/TraR C4-type domain-containing protein n=1 Tax=Arenivirga flava TaxID=1930060 RepID=A0AA37UHW7_9MICO|nr:TraR/DksA C4-type zinc finger protein [Arenivirga flava]GMA27275.1 hypothetical protein GCM10025874_05280 [Arenivirga flava]
MSDPLARLLEEAELEARRLDEALAQARAARADQGDDEHDPEGATAADDWSRFTALRQANERWLAEIARARTRRDAGAYGVCLVCGQPIAPERLAVRPTADRCRDCAERRA